MAFRRARSKSHLQGKDSRGMVILGKELPSKRRNDYVDKLSCVGGDSVEKEGSLFLFRYSTQPASSITGNGCIPSHFTAKHLLALAAFRTRLKAEVLFCG